MRLLLATALAVVVTGFAHAQDSGASDPHPGANDPNFQAAVRDKGNIPLTPQMIDDLAERYNADQRARARVDDPDLVAVPIVRSVNASLGPGGETSIIQAVKGFPTALSFIDSTGQPWPIAWDANSNPAGADSAGNNSPAVASDGLDVKIPAHGSNVLQITPRATFPRAGVLVTLQGAPKPIAFLVITGKGRYDADISVRVADRGPNAKAGIIARPNAPETGGSDLMAMLDGVTPTGASPLTVSGVSPDEVRAWKLGDRVYVRTRYTVLAPEWVNSADGADGVSIYAMPATPVVLLSDNGRTVAARFKEE